MLARTGRWFGALLRHAFQRLLRLRGPLPGPLVRTSHDNGFRGRRPDRIRGRTGPSGEPPMRYAEPLDHEMVARIRDEDQLAFCHRLPSPPANATILEQPERLRKDWRVARSSRAGPASSHVN